MSRVPTNFEVERPFSLAALDVWQSSTTRLGNLQAYSLRLYSPAFPGSLPCASFSGIHVPLDPKV